MDGAGDVKLDLRRAEPAEEFCQVVWQSDRVQEAARVWGGRDVAEVVGVCGARDHGGAYPDHSRVGPREAITLAQIPGC